MSRRARELTGHAKGVAALLPRYATAVQMGESRQPCIGLCRLDLEM